MINDPHTYQNIAAVAIGSIATVIVAFITYKSKHTQEDTDDCLKALAEVERTVTKLKASLKLERELRGIVEGNWEAFKMSFNIVFDEYEAKWSGHPESLRMMKNLKKIIDK